LGDASPRLRETLAGVAAIACEDTRVTRKLLSALEIAAPRLISYRAGNEQQATPQLLELLHAGQNVALVSDAGMPTVSDPGTELVRAARAAGASVEVVPGPSAVGAAMAASGLGGGTYYFAGFLPRQRSALAALAAEYAHDLVVAFESPHRIAESVAIIAEAQPSRSVAVCRELTKKFEETIVGSARDVAQQLAARDVKGEIVLVMEALPAVARGELTTDIVSAAATLHGEGAPLKVVTKTLAGLTGVSARELYAAVTVAE
jgi:16S rRNA (cytidine1402-2'-O)-methyltransferase